ncbi:MAG: hypothetical protein JRI43_03175 [Deltaproteobacteria bacterium]|nr:hypothetical protein [Deltaproteobacteria bacterium]MBW1912173.1 hypothetical protein [Deltaproteobacteria bacterium]
MKRLCLMIFVVMFLSGCGTAAQRSEFWEHDTMYRSWGHLCYSWTGYKNPTPEDTNQSQQENWWGIPTP